MTTTIGSLDLNAFSDLYSDSNQYFWFESDATATYGAGAHVTLVPDTSFISNPTGQNILMNTDGFSIRNGLLPMMTLDNDSLDFNIVDTTAGTYTTTATFTATGAQIGQSGSAHSVIDADGQRFYASNGTTQLANIGYASGASESGTATAPYYDFGIRKSGTTKGNYSVAEGSNTTASGYTAHAEGLRCQASGFSSHAEGSETTASGDYSHAEGLKTETRDILGTYGAHAGGIGTVTNGSARTAIGSYNEDDLQIDTFIGDGTTNQFYTTYPANNGVNEKYDIEVTVDGAVPRSISLNFGNQITINNTPPNGSVIKIMYPRTATAFVIGNGTADDARSNALTVDWNGDVEAAGEIHGALAHPTISITASTGTLQSATVYKQGNVVQLLVSIRKTSATASGQEVFKGTINTTELRPKMTTTSGTYYGSYALNATISTAGVITVRNSDSRQLAAMTGNGNISFTYLVD